MQKYNDAMKTCEWCNEDVRMTQWRRAIDAMKTCEWRNDDVRMMQWRRATRAKNIPLTLFERVRKVYSKFYCERELETEQNCNILTPTLMAITAFLSRSPGLFNLGPGAQSLWDMFLIPASFLKLIWTPTAQSGVLRAPSAGCWFSLPHLISN